MNSVAIRKKRRWRSLLRVLIPGIMLIVFAVTPAVGPALGADGGDSLYVSINASVRWDETIKDVRRNTGHLNILISGMMVRDDASSPVVSKKGKFFRPVLNYKAQSMAVTYVYSDSSITLGPQRPGECEQRVPTTYHGTIFGDMKDSAGLSINLLSSMAQPSLDNLSPEQKQFISQFQQSSTLVDWFQFHVAGPGKGMIPGTVQEGQPSCKMKSVGILYLRNFVQVYLQC